MRAPSLLWSEIEPYLPPVDQLLPANAEVAPTAATPQTAASRPNLNNDRNFITRTLSLGN